MFWTVKPTASCTFTMGTKCFHPRMDWEQWGGEIKVRLVAQGVYAKPRAFVFNAGYSP